MTMKKHSKENRMPYSLKCSSKECNEEINTYVRWKPVGEIHFIECPVCEWVNKRQISQAALDAWFQVGHDMKIRVATEAIEDIAHILSDISSLKSDEKLRLYEIEENMKILNNTEKIPGGDTDMNYEF